MKYSRFISLLLLISFLTLILVSKSSVNAETDEQYWKKREEEAEIVARASYVPDPFSVTNSFNAAVHKMPIKRARGIKCKYSTYIFSTILSNGGFTSIIHAI
ncbi:uncharacterized protein A4U43_C01F13590 [Asparagus officinalis]|uniref:Pectate lyase N-terminal domain-containing protein n=1 Tax=Asparagus officinalis TaxID=4686 RepID=A0A5P1FPN4_ASPOF|nr:uncharacterized protein A4U43_C01F13590 [Asparagus officinalis]